MRVSARSRFSRSGEHVGEVFGKVLKSLSENLTTLHKRSSRGRRAVSISGCVGSSWSSTVPSAGRGNACVPQGVFPDVPPHELDRVGFHSAGDGENSNAGIPLAAEAATRFSRFQIQRHAAVVRAGNPKTNPRLIASWWSTRCMGAWISKMLVELSCRQRYAPAMFTPSVECPRTARHTSRCTTVS